MFLCIFYFVVSVVNAACNSSWIRYESSCYLLYNASSVSPGQTWSDSRLRCQRYGGDLLKYDTENESAFISGLFQDPKVKANAYWIGKNLFLLKIFNHILHLITSMNSLGDLTKRRNCLDGLLGLESNEILDNPFSPDFNCKMLNLFNNSKLFCRRY